jgi:hypothetical protein
MAGLFVFARAGYDRRLAVGMCGNHQVAVGPPAGPVSDPSQAGEAISRTPTATIVTAAVRLPGSDPSPSGQGTPEG